MDGVLHANVREAKRAGVRGRPVGRGGSRMSAPTTASLEGRRALVTGASRGIGRSVARHLGALGADVVAAARGEADLASLVAELGPSRAQALRLDVADASAVAAALQTLSAPVDVLVCNAGIAHSAPYERTDDAIFERLVAVNVLGAFRLVRALVPGMIARGWGRVVLVASNAGLTGYAYSSAYCASKHALLGMMRAVALEIATSPVTLNAVCPGWVATDMAAAAVERIARKTGRSEAEAKRGLEEMSPKRRMVEADEVAHVVACLCAEGARGIHGQAIALDGGQTMR